MRTATGKVATVTVAFRVPYHEYERVLAMAEQRGITKLSKLLRPALVTGLKEMERREEKEREVQGNGGKGS